MLVVLVFNSLNPNGRNTMRFIR